MTFPPSSVPVYSAVSFNGRPVTSLRAGMVRISRTFFLAVCRYIQQLMVEMSATMEGGEEAERHPALIGEEELRLPSSPSVEALSKLVEKQNEQHQELMERLSQVSDYFVDYCLYTMELRLSQYSFTGDLIVLPWFSH